jgi:hypothetical protein
MSNKTELTRIPAANTLPAIALLLSDSRGIYIPQHFVKEYDLTLWQGISEDDIKTITDGPNGEFYWEVWDDVLNNATFTENGNTWRLHQDGDLWAYCLELMTDEEKSNFGMNEE